MSPRSVLAALALVVVASLIGAPLTMHDWGEQAHVSADPIESSSAVPAETPVLQYDSLSPDAQRAVTAAIKHGHTTVYGSEDWPDRFVYNGVLTPGAGRYVVVHEGQQYELTTAGGTAVGTDPLERTALQLSFVGYGLFLLYVRRQLGRDDLSSRTPATFVGAGAAFHLLGPVFDFPLLGPAGFAALGFVSFLVIGWWSVRDAL